MQAKIIMFRGRPREEARPPAYEFDDVAHPLVCEQCEGEGYVDAKLQNDWSYLEERYPKCDACCGDGVEFAFDCECDECGELRDQLFGWTADRLERERRAEILAMAEVAK